MHTKYWCLEALLPYLANFHRFDNVHSLSPQDFPSDELSPDGSSTQSMPAPDVRNSSFGSAPLLSPGHLAALLAEQTWLQGLPATSLVSQPPLATEQSFWPDPVDFPCNESYPSEFQSFPDPVYEGHGTTLVGFITNGDQTPNDFNLSAMPETQLDSMSYTDTPFGSNACPPDGENPHEPEPFPNGSPQAIQRSKRQITPVVPVSIPLPYLMRFYSHDLSAATSQDEERRHRQYPRSLSSPGNEDKIQVQPASKTRYCSHQESWGLCYLSEKEAACE